MKATVKDKIQSAIKRLGFESSDIKSLSDEEGRTVFNDARSHFVASSKKRRWWKDFRFPSTRVRFRGQNGFEYIEKIVPNAKEKIWFIVEDEQFLFYLVFEATPQAIQSVVGECHGFGYYLVAKDLSWLACETDHDDLIAIGTEVENRLRQLDG